jgi:hypothetical protein
VIIEGIVKCVIIICLKWDLIQFGVPDWAYPKTRSADGR